MQATQTDSGKLLFDDEAILVISDIADYRHDLHPAEQELIAGAILKRTLEFTTGRYCAHQGLHKLGITDFPILRGEQREPIWPEGIVGSIAHCHDIAGAVVAKKRNIKSVGLDLERRKHVMPEIARHICTDDEISWIRQQGTDRQNLSLLILFSLKEAVFKCVYQATRVQLKFKQCVVSLDQTSGKASARLYSPGISLRADELAVRFALTDTHVISAVSWRYLPAVG